MTKISKRVYIGRRKEDRFCGECLHMLEEDYTGWGYCAIQDLYTFVRCDECACEMFKVKAEEDND